MFFPHYLMHGWRLVSTSHRRWTVDEVSCMELRIMALSGFLRLYNVTLRFVLMDVIITTLIRMGVCTYILDWVGGVSRMTATNICFTSILGPWVHMSFTHNFLLFKAANNDELRKSLAWEGLRYRGNLWQWKNTEIQTRQRPSRECAKISNSRSPSV